MTPVLSLTDISKRFGAVTALERVSLTVHPGEIHGLLGENGAGKSTLMHIAFGLLSPDGGQIRVRGAPVRWRGPQDAKRAGIGMVHQHFTSIPELTVAENLWLAAGRYGHPAGRGPTGSDSSPAARLQGRLWEGLAPETPVSALPVAAKQRLEILQALATGAELLLLDEPTAVLAPTEIEELLGLLRTFVSAGGAVVLITHKLAEIFSAVDRVSVLRGGRLQTTGPIADHTVASLTVAMVGSSESETAVTPAAGGASIARLGDEDVRVGEILGVVAVEGNGQRALLHALVAGGPGTAGGATAFIPEDRSTEGIIATLSLAENLVLGLPADPRWRRGPVLDWSAARARTAQLIEEFSIRASGSQALAGTLSGGNQQKLVLARALESRPALIVAENPTRGLDVSATRFVHDRLRQAAASGAAVVVHSTDLDEVLVLATRLVVVVRGRVIAVPRGATRDAIGALMLGTGS